MHADEFWKSHGIEHDPFASQDAAQDYVFPKCRDAAHHPEWERIFGDPSYPTTSLVFGEKGSGKTAIRLQMLSSLGEYNKTAAEGGRVLVIEYEDFNPVIDTFAKNVRSDAPLEQLCLQDHMDALLSLGVTKVVGEISSGKMPAARSALRGMTESLKTDFALLAAIYDNVERERFHSRWLGLAKNLGFFKRLRMWLTKKFPLVTAAIAIAIAVFGFGRFPGLLPAWIGLAVAGLIHPTWHYLSSLWRARRVLLAMPVVRLPGSTGGKGRTVGDLGWALGHFSRKALNGRVLPNRSRDKTAEEARYQFLQIFQSILKALGFSGIVALIDRIDEPTLVAGDPERMWLLMRTLFDNKLLKHPGLGIKALLQIEVWDCIKRQDDEFRRRARLDKQHVVAPLEWTSRTLYDIASTRLEVCRAGDESSHLDDLFDESVKEDGQSVSRALLHYFDRLQPQTPRNLFNFLHEIVTEHCNRTTKGDDKTLINATTIAVAFERLFRNRL